MSAHRYPMRALAGDYARAAAGFVLTSGPLALVTPAPAVAWALGAMAVLFAAFGARTALRQGSVIRCDGEALVADGPLGARVPWRDLDRFKLSFFATRRDRAQGWMQLRVGARRGRAITVDSGLAGFEAVVHAAYDAARVNRVPFGGATSANLGAMGIVAAPADVDAIDRELREGSA